MKSKPPSGTSGETTFIVERPHCIEFATDGMPAVLSTPQLIGILERTARHALEPFLEADERSVGVEIELRHLAPAPLGAHVTVRARVMGGTGRFVDYQLEARAGTELLARGIHKRAVVRVASFAARLNPHPPN